MGVKLYQNMAFSKVYNVSNVLLVNEFFNGCKRLINDLIWQEYIQGKQTHLQLALKYNCSVKTIQRRIDIVKACRETTFPGVVNVLMDTTYFGRQLAVMIFKDSILGQILLMQYVKTESNKLYLTGVEEITKVGLKYSLSFAMDVRGCYHYL